MHAAGSSVAADAEQAELGQAATDSNFEPPCRLRRLLGRSSVRWALVFLLLLIVRLVWGWIAQHQLQGALDAIRVRGEPIELADFDTRPLTPEENAAPLIAKAGASLASVASGISSPSQISSQFEKYPPFSSRWHQLAERSESANSASFALMRQTRSFQRADFGVVWKSPAIAVLMPHLNGTNGLNNVLCDSAMLHHLRGNDAESVERIRDALHLARLLDQGPMVGHVSALMFRSLALERALVVSFDLDMPPDEIKSLIAQLLDEPQQKQALREAILLERACAVDYLRWSSARSWILRPMTDREVLRAIGYYNELLRAFDEPNFAAVSRIEGRARAANIRATPTEPLRVARVYGGYILGTFGKVNERESKLLLQSRAAAVGLAIRLYRLDHGGNWPRSLDELVPRYLPAVPRDPFADPPRALGYRLDPRPLVYSVGMDNTDDTTAGKFDSGPEFTPIEQKGADFWLDLSIPSASKAVENDPQKSDDPGN